MLKAFVRRVAPSALVVAGLLPLTQALAQQPPPQVAVATPLVRRIINWDEFSGRFEAVEAVDVRPRVSGVLEAIHFKDGQLVKAGDKLFTIDQRPFQIALDIANADIARTKAQVALQESEVERATPLAKSGTLTGREFETRQSNLSVARAQLASAEASARSAALNLDWSVVRAPISGRVSDRKVDAGNLVTGGQTGATLLTTIVSTDPIHFVFDISEADFLRYARLFMSGDRPNSRDVSNPVRIKLADETEWKHQGRMNFIDNQLNPKTGTLRGRAVMDNKDGLFQPGLFARVQLFGGEVDAILVPDAAVISDQARKIVLVVGPDNVLKSQVVVLGEIVDGLRVVRSGLAATDMIVVEGLANPAIRPGAKITPKKSEVKASAD